MKDQRLSEDEAFRRLQKKSMDLRKSMREIAEAVILAHQVKNEFLAARSAFIANKSAKKRLTRK